jgi:tetratricopeptide (TPR) repeat protein
VAIAYAGALRVPFLYDDRVVILGEPQVTQFRPNPGGPRFLGDLSFALSYRLSGDRPLGFHLANVALHLANALLVFALVRRLAAQGARADDASPRRPEDVALLAALLFAAHPLQTQAVTYLAQRYTTLATCFFLGSTYAYVRSRTADGWKRAFAWYALFLAAAGAACWTRQSAFILPLAIGILELTIFSGPPRRFLRLLPLALAGLAAALLAARSGWTLERLDAAMRAGSDLPRAEYALTQLRVVASYLRLLALPFGQNVDPDVLPSRSLAEPAVLLAGALHLSLLAFAAYAVRRGRREGSAWRLVGFGILWFYATLLVESSFLPIADLMNEHRVYLPSAGLFAAAAALLSLVPGLRPRTWAVVGAAAVLLLTGLTVARNQVWRSELSLWSDAAAKSPAKSRPANNVGVARFALGDLHGAIDAYRRAIELDPSNTAAWFNLGEALQALGACDQAIPAYRTFLEMERAYPDAYRNLAACYERVGDPGAAAAARSAWERVLHERAGQPLPNRLR